MKEATLKKVRDEYHRIKAENEILKSYKNELQELFKDEKVERFLELSKLVDKDYIEPSLETMIMTAYQKVPETLGKQNINSNHIMIFMGSYIRSNSKEPCVNYMTYERDPDTNYRLYRDLETREWHGIDKGKCLEFETKYLTLYLPISEYTEEEYCKKYMELQRWFKHKSLYPYFQRIDTIAKLPIDDYIETYPKDGFIENFCLSQEEAMRVKLYRKQKK